MFLIVTIGARGEAETIKYLQAHVIFSMHSPSKIANLLKKYERSQSPTIAMKKLSEKLLKFNAITGSSTETALQKKFSPYMAVLNKMRQGTKKC